MRKAFGVVILILAAASVAAAGSIPDGVDCAQTGALGKLVTYRLTPTNDANSDRFAICVTDGVSGNGAELYFGGELRPEGSNATRFCGAFIIGGRALAGNANWDRVTQGADPADTADDVHLTCN